MLEYRKYPLCYNIKYDSPDYSPSYRDIHHYIATDGEFVYTLGDRKTSLDFAKLKVTEPRIELSHFEGCPHYYGRLYMPDGTNYELCCIIDERYLDIAHSMRGDWQGYKVGQTTRRFLDKKSIMSAFNMLSKIVIQ